MKQLTINSSITISPLLISLLIICMNVLIGSAQNIPDRDPISGTYSEVAIEDELKLLARYEFNEGSGDVIHDVSGSQTPLDLFIEDRKSIEWNEEGLYIHQPGLIRSEKPIQSLSQRIYVQQAFTIETWISPGNTTQKGPANILNLSSTSGVELFALEQARDQIRVQVGKEEAQTDTSSSKEILFRPMLPIIHKLHVVWVRHKDGLETLFIDGEAVWVDQHSENLDNWNSDLYMYLGNKLTHTQPWIGTLHHLSIYAGAMEEADIQTRYHSGVQTAPMSPVNNINPSPMIHTLDFTLYPNPAQQLVTIRRADNNKEARISLMDLNGKQIKGVQVMDANEITFDISGIEPGTYLIKIQTILRDTYKYLTISDEK